nr:methylmalonyl-CoA mutase family protein [Melioribacter roseus]
MAELRNGRNQKEVENALENIANAVKDGKNLMPPLIDAAEKYVTLGEMVAELKKYFGTYTDVPVF